MLFNSYVFILAFLPAVLVATYAVRKIAGLTASISLLVIASLVFYGWNTPAYILLIGSSIVGNYVFGLAIAGSHRSPARSVLFALGVIGNLALLGYFKYLGFFVENAALFFGAGWSVEKIALPLAISFFTFQQIAYLADTHATQTAERDFVKYALFVSFFPQLVAGPIVHHRDLLPQFSMPHALSPSARNLGLGAAYATMGLFKKVVLADQLETYAAPAFNSALVAGETITFFEAWQAAVAFSLQIYFDFSGYSDMAVGLARMFGIRLPFNFDSPYRARNIAQFWQRWHITLSRFLRDYLYIPLGGNRHGRARRYRNLMVVMLLGGLWHGAGWTFVVWGGLHGLALIVHRLWRHVVPPLPIPKRVGAVVATLTTFVFVTAVWVPFRAETMDAALAMYRGMIGLNGFILPAGIEVLLGPKAAAISALGISFGLVPNLSILGGLLCIAGLLVVFFLPNTQTIVERTQVRAIGALRGGVLPLRLAPSAAWGLLLGAGLALGIAGLGSSFTFLYFEF